MKIGANYHTHTTFCDGSNTAEDVVQEAMQKGFTHLGFSGHMDPSVSMDYQAYIEEIKRLQKEYAGQIDIFRGAELDNVYAPEAVSDAEYYIGSTHFIPIPGSEIWFHTVQYGTHLEKEAESGIIGVDADPKILHDACHKYYDGDFYKMSERYYAFEAQVYDRLEPAFIGHFDLITRFNDLSKEDGGHFLDETDDRYLIPAKKALEKLVLYGVPFEINCGAINRGRKAQPYPRFELLRYLRELGGEILISSDAHQKELLDGGFDDAVFMTKEAGFDHINILVRKGVNDITFSTRNHFVTEGANTCIHNTNISSGTELNPAKNTSDSINGGTLYWKHLSIK